MRASVLNLVPVRQGQTPTDAIAAMVRLAQQAEAAGYHRYWIAEHHNLPHLLSSATQVLIAHVLEHTQRIRVGSGGVMLPNHSPLLVAEQYGTLALIHPGRVDLGVGRAPGTDPRTAEALRRYQRDFSADFPDDVRTLLGHFAPHGQQGPVGAWFCAGLDVPLYILGSSTESAYLAAELGLPYVFAAHFAPRFLVQAGDIYRSLFRPSQQHPAPELIVALNVVVADTDEEANHLFSSHQQACLGVVRQDRQPLQPPLSSLDERWTAGEAAQVRQMLSCSLVGSPSTVAAQLAVLQDRVQADELMTVSYIFDEQRQHTSLKLFAELL
ncbi:MAG: LLM class flavin-dependent oxidoreductase [Lautropia sp.]|nr:LLM class flavin-dependent oxidoreductase [Lautropia sp.]